MSPDLITAQRPVLFPQQHSRPASPSPAPRHQHSPYPRTLHSPTVFPSAKRRLHQPKNNPQPHRPTSTILVPSLNRALNKTFALVNSPSLSETTMNWLPLNRFRKSCPMCCVCCRSSAASISSRMYMGAGLNWRSDMMRDSAMRELSGTDQSWAWCRGCFGTHRCPPLSSVRLAFHTVPSRTLTSSPSVRSCPSGGCNFAKFPGRSSSKINPKSLQPISINFTA